VAPVPASFACANLDSATGQYAYPSSAGASFPEPSHATSTNINAASYTSYSNTSSPASYGGPSAIFELPWVSVSPTNYSASSTN
jgi:hypothetical protein